MVIAALATFATLLAAWIAAPSTERRRPHATASPVVSPAELIAEGA